ncbi:MAG TPA: hypothetical protein PKZ76_03435 [Xanthomonadaceae bacterium]|nr:hypothetical protein [Xanthomonadaceae bacterium]
MSACHWKRFRPGSLQAAIEGCIDYARERRNLSIDRIADLMGVASKWTLYKWVAGASIPLHMVRAFEHATGATFVTQYLAISAHRLLIDFPTGRLPRAQDLHQVQEVCTEAVGALLQYANQKLSSDDTRAVLARAIERLASEHAHVALAVQPALEL